MQLTLTLGGSADKLDRPDPPWPTLATLDTMDTLKPSGYIFKCFCFNVASLSVGLSLNLALSHEDIVRPDYKHLDFFSELGHRSTRIMSVFPLE